MVTQWTFLGFGISNSGAGSANKSLWFMRLCGNPSSCAVIYVLTNELTVVSKRSRVAACFSVLFFLLFLSVVEDGTLLHPAAVAVKIIGRYCTILAS